MRAPTSHGRRFDSIPSSLLTNKHRLESLRAVHHSGREQGPEEVQVFRHPAPVLQEGTRLGVEEVHGALEGSRRVHRGGHARDQGPGAGDPREAGAAVSVPGTPVQARASQGVPHQRRRDLPQVSRGAPGPARQVPGGLGPMG